LDSLVGQLLVAMPQMQDHRFQRAVIYICAHRTDGAMGLVLNKLMGELTLPQVLQQLGVASPGIDGNPRVHFGGPVDAGRGFVLHSTDYIESPATVQISENVALTATLDILRAIGRGEGPRKSFLALGYAGWGKGQLDLEMERNDWLHAPANESIVFDNLLENKWQRAFGQLGIDLSMLSIETGHA